MKKLSNAQWKKIDKIIKNALKEDVGSSDITTEAIFEKYKLSSAEIIAKENGILAGIDVVMRVFKLVDSRLVFKILVTDGEKIFPKLKVAKIKGDVRSILKAERTALNFLGRMSGIASFTNEYVKKIEGTNAKILDTRKTAPNLRILDKYAVSVGGGFNHRMGLYDMFLIKDNHIKEIGSLRKAVEKTVIFGKSKRKNWKIEVEAENIKQVREALASKVDRIMLDNMNLEMIKKSVRIVDKKAEVEVSGNVNLEVIRDIALTGVDFISIGALTHSVKNLDFSLLTV